MTKFNFNLEKFAQNRYNHLLTSLITLLFLGSLINQRFLLGQILMSFAFLSTILLVLRTLSLPRKVNFYLNILAIIAFALNLIYFNVENQEIEIVFRVINYGIYIIFISLAIIIISIKIFNGDKVTKDTLKGGISIYLMIGLLWYLFYEIIFLIDTNAFSMNSEASNLIYFSYTTLTTVGYGDISPINPFAMILSNFEAIIGQMYPAIFIARLVTLYDNEENSP